MAVYLFTVKTISRGKDGGNMLAAAAYRSGSRLVERAEWDPGSAVARAAHAAGEELADSATGRAWDFSRKTVEFSEIALPDGAPGWMVDRQSLWSAVEASERRCDARLGREIILGLPRELDREAQLELVRDFVAEHVTARGMVCDWSLHEPTASDGKPQPHCHLLTTTRAIDPAKPTGFGKKMRELDRRDLIVSWRQGWEQSANRALEMAGREERIDGRSIAARLEAALEVGDFAEVQRWDREPLPHLGAAVHAMERAGIGTELGDTLRALQAENRERAGLYEMVRGMGEDVPEAPARFLAARAEAADPAAAFESWSAWALDTLERVRELAREIAEPVREMAEAVVERLHDLGDWLAGLGGTDGSKLEAAREELREHELAHQEREAVEREIDEMVRDAVANREQERDRGHERDDRGWELER